MPFTSWDLDFQQELVAIELSDGSRQTVPMPAAMAMATAGAPFVRSRLDFANRTLIFTLSSGDELIVEVGAAGAADGSPEGRPVVYVDQLHWISLARHRYTPEKLSEATASAATTLVELAETRRILLPLSARPGT